MSKKLRNSGCSQMKTLLHGNTVTDHTGHFQTYYPGTHRREKKPSQRKACKPPYYDIYMVVIIISFLLRKAFEGWRESYLLSSELFLRILCEAAHLPPTKRSLN